MQNDALRDEKTNKQKNSVEFHLKCDLAECCLYFLCTLASFTEDSELLNKIAIFIHENPKHHVSPYDDCANPVELLEAIVQNPCTTEDTIKLIINDGDFWVKCDIADRKDISEEMFWLLSNDEHGYVLLHLSKNPNLPSNVFHHLVERIILDDVRLDPMEFEYSKLANELLCNKAITEEEIQKLNKWLRTHFAS